MYVHNIICLVVYAYFNLKHRKGGEHLRTRKILRHPKYGGKTCDGALAELKATFFGLVEANPGHRFGEMWQEQKPGRRHIMYM